jgi:Family of unknown function (DUF6455)
MRPWSHRAFKVDSTFRLELRRRMMRALGIRVPHSLTYDEQEQVRETISACSSCNHTDACSEWLTGEPTAGAAPEFCPNRQLFQKLGRRN